VTLSASPTPVSVSWRFWLGSILPAVALAGVVGLLVTTGAGKREAPMIVFFASLIAVPGIVLLNGWVLFVPWRRRASLVAAASVLPAIVALGCALFVHGSGRWQELGMLPLAPFLLVPTTRLGTFAVLWVLAIVALLLTARHIAAKGRRQESDAEGTRGRVG
jgi:hypothetical protein